MSCRKAKKSLVPVIRLEKAVTRGRHCVLPEDVFKRILDEDIPEKEVLQKYQISRHIWYTSKVLYKDKYGALFRRQHRNRLARALAGNRNGERQPARIVPKEKIREMVEAGYSLLSMSRRLKMSEFLVRRNITIHGLERSGELPRKIQATDMETLRWLDDLSPGLLEASKHYNERPQEFFEALYVAFARLSQRLWFIQSLAGNYRYLRGSHQIPKSHITWSLNKSELQLSLALLDAGIPHVRQYFIEKYMMDFAFPKAKVAVEVDGEYHKTDAMTRGRDTKKEAKVISCGWKVLHFTTKQVERELLSVISAIRQQLSPASSQ